MTTLRRTLALFVGAALLAGSVRAGSPSPAPDPMREIFTLNSKTAAERGKADAKKDYAAGTYRILVYGLRKKPGGEEKQLADKGIIVDAVAGCVVSEGLLAYANTYNSVMLPLLKKKFGERLLKETGYDR